MKHFCSFSEAIRSGIPMIPQAFYTYWVRGIGACALGTGAIAVNESVPTSRVIDELVDGALNLYPYMLQERRDLRCPLESEHACGPMVSLKHVVAHLNDNHKWFREDIAAWLEEEEEKIGFVTLIESESSSKSLQRAVLGV